MSAKGFVTQSLTNMKCYPTFFLHKVMSMSQRDVLMCLHENGGVTLRVRRRNQVSTPSPEQVSTFGTQGQSSFK